MALVWEIAASSVAFAGAAYAAQWVWQELREMEKLKRRL